FGAMTTLDLHAQAAGVKLFAPEFLAAAPYLATVLVLALLSLRRGVGAQAPACLGKPFRPAA
ncbi:MAG: ABC transporter permease, partial [Neomegalonema sp.]|nr:ABC transporter permease [Neomegalonema sp.]